MGMVCLKGNRRMFPRFEESKSPLHQEAPVAIYVLVDPRDETVRYVGKATNFARRKEEHLSGDLALEKNKKLRAWKQELRALGAEPFMRIVERTFQSRWEKAERGWIKFYRAQGTIYNVQPGGLVRAVMRGGKFLQWEPAPHHGATAPRIVSKRKKKKGPPKKKVKQLDQTTGVCREVVVTRADAQPQPKKRKKSRRGRDYFWKKLGN